MNEPLIALFKEKFFHRKSIGGVAFFGNCTTGQFSGKIFSSDTPQVILDLMTPILYHVGGLSKRAIIQTDTQILSIIYLDIDYILLSFDNVRKLNY